MQLEIARREFTITTKEQSSSISHGGHLNDDKQKTYQYSQVYFCSVGSDPLDPPDVPDPKILLAAFYGAGTFDAGAEIPGTGPAIFSMTGTASHL